MLYHVYSNPFKPNAEFLSALTRLYDQFFTLKVITFGEFSESVRELLAQGFVDNYELSNSARVELLAALDFIQCSNIYVNDKMANLISAIKKDAGEETETNSVKLTLKKMESVVVELHQKLVEQSPLLRSEIDEHIHHLNNSLNALKSIGS